MSVLERNLAALAATSPRVAERIRGAGARGDVVLETGADGGLTGSVGAGPSSRRLASRHRPLEEAQRLAESVDVAEAAGIVVLGFGVGHHLSAIAQRLGRTGVLVCFEPDVGLLRAVLERIDLVPMMRATNFLLLVDPDDLAEMSASIRGVEGVLAVGVKIIPHPPSRARLGEAAERFSALFAQVMRSVRTTVVTTLVQSEVTLRNLLANLGAYATAGTVEELKGCCAGRPAVVVSAGPSLRRNLDQLARPGVRERFVIIAVQTVLKQMLARGIRPHFVTALDYHEISRRFYEGLTAEDVAGVTLVAEAKANPAILESFPGAVRCPADAFLDTLLGEQGRKMGDLPQGATVAHLAYYLARHIGCDPVILIGQDLGFTDGQYYPAGAAIHRVWSGELNPFRTLEMLEWERIVRNRRHLIRATDHLGRPVYTDEQMSTYLVQFERDFLADAGRGLTVIDATEGGVAKKSARVCPLAEALGAHGRGPAVVLPSARPAPDASPRRVLDPGGTRWHGRLTKVAERVRKVRGEVWQIAECSRRAHDLLSRMLELEDQVKINALIEGLNRENAKVRSFGAAFTLVEFLNQTGALNRFKADRALELARGMSRREEQSRRIERDRTNVKWIGDAAEELGRMLEDAVGRLEGRGGGGRGIGFPADAVRDHSEPSAPASTTGSPRESSAGGAMPRGDAGTSAGKPMPRVAAIVHFDGARGGLGNARSASEPFLLGRTALGLTLERLSRCESLDGVIVLADDPAEARRVAGPMLENPSRGFARIEFVAWPGRDARRAAIAAGRLWAPACWRGGLGGLTCYDELSEPGAAAGALRERGFGAGVLVGADWALVDPALVDAVVRRHRESPEKYRVVFTQAAPGLAGCLVDVGILEELASQAETAGVFATIGGLLGYVPIAPQLDPIGKSVCVAAAPAVRDVNYRCIPDAEPRRRLLAEALVPLGARALDAGAEEIAGLVAARVAGHGSGPPQQVVLELCTGRLTSGRRGEWMRGFGEMIERPSMTPDLAERVLGPLCAARGDVAVTLAGAGDPLLHPGWREFVDLARRCGAAGVHVRTDLICGPEVLDALIESGVDVVSVDVMAMDAGTYRELMGVDRLVHVRGNVESLARRRGTGLGLPWIVPRMTRCDAVYGQVERFYDEHLMRLGAAVIDALPAPAPGERIEPLPWPEEAARRADLEAMTVLADGSAPAGMNDLRCEHPAANAGREGVLEAWRKVAAARRERWSGWPARKAG